MMATKILGVSMFALALMPALAAPALGQDRINKKSPPPSAAVAADIEWGDDSGEWANDGECDDPRFSGTGSAVELLESDTLKDATDCKAAFEAGTVTLTEDDTQTIDWGDDSSEWAKDGECDDPRFSGSGSAVELLESDTLKDATDCKAAFEAGSVTLVEAAESTTTAAIDFGDDTSQWAKDDECDDPRFSGTGVADELVDADIGHDATDCRAAVEAGTASFEGQAAAETVPVVQAFEYGQDWSRWANDGECDDLRFIGAGTDKKLLSEDTMGDATDCRTLEAEGTVSIRKVYSPAYLAGAPYDSSHVEFGDNASEYARDERCDDPRFEGPGAAAYVIDTDEMHDADDCRSAYEAGTVLLISEAE